MVRAADPRSSIDHIVVRRGAPLSGTVLPGGAKNSVLKLMAATLLAQGSYELTNVPGISDVGTMAMLLQSMGVCVTKDATRSGVLHLDVPASVSPEAPYELASAIRASIVVLGPLLTRCGEARVALPGGDDFGTRPVDLHIRGLQAMGAMIELKHGVLHAIAPSGLHGAEFTLDFPSVGATENIVLAAVGAKGTTVLDNAAREPEITNLLNMLQAMGADIEGVGTSTVTVHGRALADLVAVSHRTVPDRLEVATYLAALAVAGGELTIRDGQAAHMQLFLSKLRQMGMTITDTGTGLYAYSPGRIRSVDFATLPYPGIATDFKPFITAMLSVGDGVGIVTENLYAGRFRYIEELVRMGADIRTSGHHAVVRGVPRLQGAPVRAHDIRAGACLIVAGLGADGETVIADPFHVDRGYENLVPMLAAAGADVERVRN